MHNRALRIIAWREFRIIFIIVLMGLSGLATAETIYWPVVVSASAYYRPDVVKTVLNITTTKVPVWVPIDKYKKDIFCVDCMWEVALVDKNGSFINSDNTTALSLSANDKTHWSDIDEQVDQIPNYLTGGIFNGSRVDFFTSQTCAVVIAIDRSRNIYFPENLNVQSVCKSLTPTNLSCSFSANRINFLFGELGKHSAPGSSLQKDIQITCSGPAVISISGLWADGNIPLSNGMKSILMIDNKKPGTSIDVKNGYLKKYITISETLSGTPNQLGSFTGSDVLRINFE